MVRFTLKVYSAVGQVDALRFSAHRQQAISRNALVCHHAEEPARRHARIVHEPLKIATGGKPFTQLPGIDRGNREPQILGDLLQRDMPFHSPVAERRRKAGADIAAKIRVFRHSQNLRQV